MTWEGLIRLTLKRNDQNINFQTQGEPTCDWASAMWLQQHYESVFLGHRVCVSVFVVNLYEVQ